jgi:hypothetical protein
MRAYHCVFPAVLLASCAMEAEPTKPSTIVEDVRAIQERMHARFASVQRIERGVVTSNVDEVRAGASAIATLDEPKALPTWQPYVAAMRDAARRLMRVEDPVAAAQLTAELGRQCGRCHQAIGAVVVFREPPRPDAGPKLQETMQGHEWAVARMWEGVIAPSEERWTIGARALERARLTYVAESGELGIADDVMTIRQLARRAPALASHTERAELYGQLLATCAGCHATIRD